MWQNNTNNLKLSPRLIALLAGVLIIMLIVLGSINALRFHLVAITPGLSSIGPATPYVDFKYNKVLLSSVVVSSTPEVIKSSSVDGKTLRLYLTIEGITAGSKYRLHIKSVSSKLGDKLIDKSYGFTAKDIRYNNLSADQKSYLVTKQDKFVYSRKTVIFTGDDYLIDRGISDNQMVVFQQAVFEYSKTVNKQFDMVTIEAGSIVQSPYDSSSSNPLNVLNFDASVDNQNYHFKLSASGFTTAQLQIYDKSGATLLYDSGAKEPISD